MWAMPHDLSHTVENGVVKLLSLGCLIFAGFEGLFFVSATQTLGGVRLYFVLRYGKLSVRDGAANV